MVIALSFRRNWRGSTRRSNCRIRSIRGLLRFFPLLNLLDLSDILLVSGGDVGINNKYLDVFDLLFFLFFLRLHGLLRVVNYYVNILHFLLDLAVFFLTLGLLPDNIVPIAWDLAHEFVGHDLFIGDCLSQIISFVVRRGT